jgi:hypothetical protein
MFILPSDLAEVLSVYEATEQLLRELEALGFKYKRVYYFFFEPGEGPPKWRGIGEEHGIVVLTEKAEPRSVAHEMGHGFFECLNRDYALPEQFSQPSAAEAFADAIRWFVEEHRLGGRKWEPQGHTVLLDQCRRDFSEFKAMLQRFPRRPK